MSTQPILAVSTSLPMLPFGPAVAVKTVRFRITASETTTLQQAVSELAIRLEMAMQGYAPHRHPWDRIDLIASDVYRDKEFYEDLAAAVLSCRDKLAHLGASRKIRLNVWEISAAQLALRFAAKEKHLPVTKALARLQRKLKTHGLRAKRRAVKQLGDDRYKADHKRWKQFLGWMRYYLLYDRMPRKRSTAIKRTWKWQFAEIMKLAKQAIEKRSHVALSDDVLRVLVKRAVDTMRRRDRPGISVMTAIRNPAEGERFLFAFISARINLQPLKMEFFSPYVQPSRVAVPSIAVAPTSSRSMVPLGTKPDNTPAVATQSASEGGVQFSPLKSLSDERLAVATCDWLRENYDPSRWDAILEETSFQLARFPPRRFTFELPGETLQEVIEKSRPKNDPDINCDDLNYAPAWLINFLLTLTGNPSRIYRIAERGLALANLAAEREKQDRLERELRERRARLGVEAYEF